jgi:maltooligosyltrehalose trehalohydrolase
MNDRRHSQGSLSALTSRPTRTLPDTLRDLDSESRWMTSLGSWLVPEGVRFRVWAPERAQVDVVLERSRDQPLIYPLKQEPGGYFSGTVPPARAGQLYRYRVDGGTMYPDPASRYQPEGVHGPSKIVDPGAFSWSDSNWKGRPLKELIIYELHVGTFSPEGSFDGVTRKLPHLVDLGVTAIELMPVGDFPGLRNWGYDGVAPYAPARCYGMPDDLRHLVDAAHHTGLAVLLDVVYNHLGPDGNYTGVFSPYYVTSRHSSPWGQGLNFDGEHSADVREFFIQNALHWIHEYHMDGLRLDATHAIQDDSTTHVLAELTDRVQRSVQGRQVHLIAEDDRNEISLIRSKEFKGMGLSAVWADDFHHQIRRTLAGDTDGYYADYSGHLPDLVKTVQQGWFYTGQDSQFSKHPRGSPTGNTPLERFIFCIQNHDQIGNRAFGDRLNHAVDTSAYRAASALLLLLPETPLLFMGQEWAASSPFQYFTDHDEDLGKAVTEGRRKEFQSFAKFAGTDIPDPQSPDTFRRSKLNWSEISLKPHKDMWQFYQAVLHMRQDLFSSEADSPGLAAEVVGSSTLLVRRKTRDNRDLIAAVHLKGKGTASWNESSFKAWEVVLTSEEKAYAPDPHPPNVEFNGPRCQIEFKRPGIVLLRESAS